MSLIIIDDFYVDPLAVRKLALSSYFHDVTQLNYPGFQTTKAFASTQIKDRFEKIIGGKIQVDQEQMTYGKFRLMLEEEKSCIKIHLDGGKNWTGLVYLNTPEQEQGGTAFFRHIKSGISTRLTDQESQNYGYLSWQDLFDQQIRPDTYVVEAWEQIDYIGMKFNRLAIFPGDHIFHSHTSAFGKDLKTGRLTQNFFFKVAL